MKPSLELLSQQFTALIGPEAFAKAEAAIAAHKAAAAEAAAKAAASAKAAAEAAAAAKAAAAAAPKPAVPAAAPASTQPVAERVSVSPQPAVGGAGLRPALPATPQPAAPAATHKTAAAPAAQPVAERVSVSPKPTAPAAPRESLTASATATAAKAAAPAAAAAPKPAAPALPPPPPLPLQKTNHAEKGFDLDAAVAPDQVVAAAQLLDAQGFGLDAVTGVDWIAQNEMEVVYDFFHPTEQLRVVVRTRVPRANPELPTISTVFPGANWHERETHDFFGIRFAGHPQLTPFLLPEDADFHPLRKDYNP